MSRQNRIFHWIALVAPLALAGCGGSGGGTTGRVPTEADLQATMQQVVLPTMQQLGVQSATTQQPTSPPAAAPEGGGPSCWDLDFFCSDGAFQWCFEGQEGALNFDWNYESCAQQDATRDGTWSLDLSEGHASALFALSVDDVALAGNVSYIKTGSCWTHAVDGFVANGPRHTVTIDGAADYCPSTRPVGQWQLDVTGETTYHALFVFDENVGTLHVVDTEGTVHDCTIDMATREVTCEEA
jgi:hypothetical protein